MRISSHHCLATRVRCKEPRKEILAHMYSSTVLLPALPPATVGPSWRRRQQQQRCSFVARKSVISSSPATAPDAILQHALLVKKEHEPSVKLSGGTLEFLSFEGATALSTWQEGSDRRVRVWLPPRFGVDAPPKGGYPTFILCDGQNLFDDELSFAPQSW